MTPKPLAMLDEDTRSFTHNKILESHGF